MSDVPALVNEADTIRLVLRRASASFMPGVSILLALGALAGLLQSGTAPLGRVVLGAAFGVFGFLGICGLRISLGRTATMTFRSDALVVRHPYLSKPLALPWSGVHSVWAQEHGWSAPRWDAPRRTIDLTHVFGPGRFNLLVVLVPEIDLRPHVRFGANFIGSKLWSPISAEREVAGLCGTTRTPGAVASLLHALGRPTSDEIPRDVAEWVGRRAIPVNWSG